MHSLEFAGFQLLLAIQQKSEAANFDPVAYSVGYGSHLAMDAVGHNPHGFLAGKWMDELEFGCDSLMRFNNTPPLARFADRPEAVSFVVAAAADYSEKTHIIPPYNSTEIRGAELAFDVGVGIDWIMTHENTEYQEQLIRMDPYGSSSWNETLSHLKVALACSADAARFWTSQLLSTKDPNKTAGDTRSYVTAMFKNGKCSPK